MNYLFPVTAINRDGTTRVLDTVADVLAFVHSIPTTRYAQVRVGQEWLNYDPRWSWLTTNAVDNEWILRDDRGRPVDFNDFIPADSRNWKKRRRNKRGNFIFRDGPVPGRGSYRGCGTCQDAPRKRHGGRGVVLRAEMHRREFHELMGKPRIRRGCYTH